MCASQSIAEVPGDSLERMHALREAVLLRPVEALIAGQRLALELQVNAAKSACARSWKRQFLGDTLTNVGGVRFKVTP